MKKLDSRAHKYSLRNNLLPRRLFLITDAKNVFWYIIASTESMASWYYDMPRHREFSAERKTITDITDLVGAEFKSIYYATCFAEKGVEGMWVRDFAINSSSVM